LNPRAAVKGRGFDYSTLLQIIMDKLYEWENLQECPLDTVEFVEDSKCKDMPWHIKLKNGGMLAIPNDICSIRPKANETVVLIAHNGVSFGYSIRGIEIGDRTYRIPPTRMHHVFDLGGAL